MERAAMREFGNESKRVLLGGWHVQRRAVRLGRQFLRGSWFKVEGALFFQESEIAEDVLLNFARLCLRVN